MPYFYPMDIYYLLLVMPALIIAFIAQINVSNTFKKYSLVDGKVKAEDVIRKILDRSNLQEIKIEKVNGSLTDHYDPRAKAIRLSEVVYGSSSVSAIGVAAHETGHAIQKKENYFPIKIRNAVFPVVQFASYAAVPLALIGLIFQNILLNIGIILFTAVVFFELITLPLEFDASKRAITILREDNILSEEDLQGVKKVLTAAALTYVASALSSVMNLLRIILIARDRRN